MSAWEELEAEKKDLLLRGVRKESKDLIEDAKDEWSSALSSDEELDELCENLWDMYLCGSVESVLEDELEIENDEDDEGEFAQILEAVQGEAATIARGIAKALG